MINDKRMRLLAAVVGAMILSILSPPLNLAWLQWVAYLPMFWALDPDNLRANVRLSWLYGTVGLMGLFSWIVHTIIIFSPIPWIGAVAILLLFSAVFGAQYALLWPAVHPMRRAMGAWWVLAFPAWEVLLEWVGTSLLSLFPYQHGAGQFRVPWIWQLASVTGVWGVSYLVFLVNAALAEIVFRIREQRAFPRQVVGGVAAVVLVVLAYGGWRYHRVSEVLDRAPTLRVAQIQSDLGMEYRLTHSQRDAWKWWLVETHQIAPGTADLVVWPEGASPYDLNEDPEHENLAPGMLSEEAKRGGFEMIVGAGTRVRKPDAEMGEDRVSVFNSTYFFDADGTIAGHYDKMKPLPFGEYLPFRSWWPSALVDALPIGDFEAGTEPVMFQSAHGKIATPICYEAILPDTCRQFRDADLLAVVTNDAWFGDTANPYQHAMLAAARSMELGIPMFRSAYTGVSFVAEPDGDILDQTKPFQKVDRVVEVKLAKFDTFYARFGNWFVGLCAAGTLLAGIAVRSTPGALDSTRPTA